MNAYEFTRFEADFTAKEKVKGYDVGTVEYLIEYNAHGKNLRADAEYIDARDTFIELTMSCNEAEALNWLKYWAANAIAYGNQTRNKDWRHKFLAANDLYRGILSRRSVGVRWDRSITG